MTGAPPLVAALSYAERDLYVLPLYTRYGDSCSCGGADCEHQGKHPRIRRGHHGASVDPAQIEAWFTAWPDANIGIACARSGWLTIDVDPRNGGEQTLARLIAELGPLPSTLTARTGGGGRHLVFNLPTGVRFRSELGLGVDLKVNGYIVAEPSVTVSQYRWESSLDRPPAKVPPAWLQRMSRGEQIAEQRRRPRAANDSGMPIPDGTRNTTLHRRACAMRRAGFSRAAITAAVMAENQGCCKPPLPAADVRSIANSASDYLPPHFTNAVEFFKDDRLTSSDRHVLRAIVDHANAEGCAFPSYETLASETALSRATVAAAIKRLKQTGRITVKRRPFRSSLYRIIAFSPHVVLSSQHQPPHPPTGSYGPVAGLLGAEQEQVG
jgi:hypothetical protein